MLSTLYALYVVRCTLYAVRWWGVPVRTPCTLLYVHCKKWAASAAEGLLLHFMPVWVDTCAQMLVNSVQAASVVTCCYSLQGTLCLSWAHAAPCYTLAITSQVDVATGLAAAEATIAPLA